MKSLFLQDDGFTILSETKPDSERLVLKVFLSYVDLTFLIFACMGGSKGIDHKTRKATMRKDREILRDGEGRV